MVTVNPIYSHLKNVVNPFTKCFNCGTLVSAKPLFEITTKLAIIVPFPGKALAPIIRSNKGLATLNRLGLLLSLKTERSGQVLDTPKPLLTKERLYLSMASLNYLLSFIFGQTHRPKNTQAHLSEYRSILWMAAGQTRVLQVMM